MGPFRRSGSHFIFRLSSLLVFDRIGFCFSWIMRGWSGIVYQNTRSGTYLSPSKAERNNIELVDLSATHSFKTRAICEPQSHRTFFALPTGEHALFILTYERERERAISTVHVFVVYATSRYSHTNVLWNKVSCSTWARHNSSNHTLLSITCTFERSIHHLCKVKR